AQPTEAVTAILKVTGDWQKFKGLPAPEPMKLPAQKPDKQALFNAALAEVSGDPGEESGATTPKKRAAKAAPKAKADVPAEAPASPKAEAPAAEAPAAEAPAAEAPAPAEAEPAAESSDEAA